MSDRLHDTLTSLRTDIDGVPLADSAAVRRRGNQRTRRQAVGSSLAVVALVAGAVGIGGALVGENKAEQIPAPQPTITTTEDSTPEPTTSAPERLVLDDRVLLEADELPDFPNQPFSVGQTLDPVTTDEAMDLFLTACNESLDGGVSPESAIARTFVTDLDVSMWQWVAAYPSVADAERAVTGLRAACGGAGFASEDVATGSTMPGAQEAFRASRFSADPGSEFNGELTGVVRLGQTVAVVGLRGMLRETDVDVEAFDASLASAAQRLTTL